MGWNIDTLDRGIGRWMLVYGHLLHRVSLGILFVWFGLLKTRGHETASSLLAHTIYWGSPEIMVPVLGWWEFAIGVCLLVRRLNRLGLLLLLIRLPGTFLAFVLLTDVCFTDSPLVPTPEGQYLIKDMVLFAAAMVIGGTIRTQKKGRVYH